MTRFSSARVAAPVAPKRPRASVVHGTPLIDDYAWLKADNWRAVLKDAAALPAEIRAHLVAENDHAAAVMSGTEDLRKTLVREMRGRIQEDESSVPSPDGPFAYYERYRRGGEHPLVCRAPRAGGVEHVLLDADRLADDKDFFDLGDAAHSPDHRWLAWSADETGSEYYAIAVRDLASGRDLPDAIADTTGEVVWLRDGTGFYYVGLDDNHRASRVFRHLLEGDEADELIYEEADPGWMVDLDETQSGAFGVITTGDHDSSEAWLLDLADAKAPPRCVAAREPLLRYEVDHHGERLIILTNADGCDDMKLVEVRLDDPRRANWRDLVPYRAGVMILSHVVFRRHLVRLERQDARPRIVVRELASGAEHAIAFAEEAYALGLDGGYEFDTTQVRFVYASMTTPPETYDYDMATRERRLLKREQVPSGHDPADYVTRRLMAPAPDGALVPVSILYRRGLARDGAAPCLLYGYGAYGSALSAGFRGTVLSLVDRGFVYAIAHVRGGTEKGWHWYLDGKRDNKRNSFTDFIAVAEHLIAERYTAKGRIVAQGGSAGGMLMGAVANLAPELFAGIVADVPFVDVLNTMLDGDLPLTPPEWPEWGNPGASEHDFATIRAYSPYDCVAPRRYPPILALGGLADPRVTYWEPAKWVAKLRAVMTGGGPVLLDTNLSAGHAGATGRFDSLKEVALIYAFALAAVADADGDEPPEAFASGSPAPPDSAA